MPTSLPDPDQTFALIASAMRCFGAVQPDNVNVPSLIQGLDFLCRAALLSNSAGNPNRPLVNSELWRIAPIISAEVEGAIPAERIFLVLGMASSLLSAVEDDFHFERVAHVTVLAADLKAFVLRRWLASQGGRLERSIAINQAWAADRAPSVLH